MSDESVKPWLESGAPSPVARLLESAADDAPSPVALGKLSARLAAAGLLGPGVGPGGGGDGGGGAPHAPSPASHPVGPSQVVPTAAGLAKPVAAVSAKVLLFGAVGAAAIGVGGFQAGRVVERRAQEERREAEALVAVKPPEPVAPAPAPVVKVPPAPAPEPEPVKPAAPVVKPAPKPVPAETVNPDQEAELLTKALAASGQKDWAAALDAAEQHARRFPHGTLAQEREMIAIEALLGLSRRPEAIKRAEAFRKAWPTSTHLVRLNTLLGQ